MSTVVDGRIAARRRKVREAGARRRLRRVLGVVAFAGLAGFIGWLFFQSTLLAVSEIAVTGHSNAPAEAIVAQSGLTAGIPTITVDEAAVEAALEADPWVAKAQVRVTWPGTVEVTVLEHIPAGWVAAGDRWVLASSAGAVLMSAAAPPEGAPVIELGSRRIRPGKSFTGPMVVGALEFAGTLPAPLAEGAVVTRGRTGLEAEIAGHQVVLGRPDDMAAKARAMVALVDAGLASEAVVNLVSPTRPAVTNPKPKVQGWYQVDAKPQPSG
jgi:cell division protein FtsQ